MKQRCWAMRVEGGRCENLRDFLYNGVYCEFHAHLLHQVDRQATDAARLEMLLERGLAMLAAYDVLRQADPAIDTFIQDAFYALLNAVESTRDTGMIAATPKPELMQQVNTTLSAYNAYPANDTNDREAMIRALDALADVAFMLPETVLSNADDIDCSTALEALLLQAYEFRRPV